MEIWDQRELSNKEAEFIRRAIEKIADEGKYLVSDIERNDVKLGGSQLILELEYVIQALRDPVCSWNEKKSNTILEYYTLKADLYELPFLNYITTPIIPINLNKSLKEFKKEIISYITKETNEPERTDFEVFDSLEEAFQTLGPDKKFYWSESNFDGVPSPNNSLVGITKTYQYL
jgi:hypothetical protein